jgi:SpoVK/Ycf46/Vps4 family AAA+-type ATPase
MMTKNESRRSWRDLALPDDSLAQLRALCRQALSHGHGPDETTTTPARPTAPGVRALFAGGSRTPKRIAAEVIANELGRALLVVDLTTIVSKYIGETEKNLDRTFSTAASTNAVLYFDEADALFGKRSEVKDSHDRYANLETGYFLERLEQHPGLVILATHLHAELDPARLRRIAYTIDFPTPPKA